MKRKLTVLAIVAMSFTVFPAAAQATSYHYDTATTPSDVMTVSTPVCNGGGVITSSSWDNRIDGTKSNCDTNHYDSRSFTSYMVTTLAPGYVALPWLFKNRTGSLTYV